MNWALVVFSVVFILVTFQVLDSCGAFLWVSRRINEEPRPAVSSVGVDDFLRLTTAFETLKSDVDKIKLSIQFKEFKK